MIQTKIILSLLLTAIPFYYLIYRRYFCEKNEQRPTMVRLLQKVFPWLMNFFRACKSWLSRVHDRMKVSDQARKFFTLIVLLVLLAVNFFDMQATDKCLLECRKNYHTQATIADNKPLQELSREDKATFYHARMQQQMYADYATAPLAALLANAIMIVFFFYKSSDKVLMFLRHSRKTFVSLAVVSVVILYFPDNYFILSEVIFVLLGAATIYPDKILPSGPNGGQRIYDKEELQMAA